MAAIGPDERALRDLASAGGGVFDPEPAVALRIGGPRGLEPVPLWPWALLAAAALVTVDLWLRRLARRRALPDLSVAGPAAPSPATAPVVRAEAA
jgi:hypothetical protein